MNLLSIYTSEKQHYSDMPLYEWLLEEARAMGVHGGSAFRAIAGFGRHGRIHEDTFFELAGELAVKVEFVLDDVMAERLIEKIRHLNKDVYYLKQTVETGTA